MTNAHSKHQAEMNQLKEDFELFINECAIRLINNQDEIVTIGGTENLMKQPGFITECIVEAICCLDYEEKKTLNRDLVLKNGENGTLSIFWKNDKKIKKSDSNRKCTCGKWKNATEFKKCAGCEHIYYCCKECQVADWVNHKPYCKK
jgi:hypothetical protein